MLMPHFCTHSRLLALEADTLSEPQRVALLAHLRSCPRCAEIWRQMQAARQAFASANSAQPALSEAAADALFLRAIALSRPDTARRAAPQRRGLSWAIGGGLAATGLTCGLVYFAAGHALPPASRPAPLRTAAPLPLAPRTAAAPAARPGVAPKRVPAEFAAVWPPLQAAPLKLARSVPGDHLFALKLSALKQTRPALQMKTQAKAPGLSDDMAYVNTPPLAALAAAQMPPPESARLQREIDRAARRGDDFVAIPFPQIAGLGERALRAAATSYRCQREIVDPRLTYRVTLAVKGVSFAALCDRLTQETGITLTAGKSVMDDKVTIFCEKRSLRDLMRQISRHFGFSWRRTSETGPFEYELYQDVGAQLMEGELRNKDRDEALRAIDRVMETYRPHLNKTRDQLLQEAEKTSDQDRADRISLSLGLLPPIKLYSGLTPEQTEALYAGQEIRFREKPEEGDLPLPAALLPTLPAYFEEAARQAEKQAGERPTFSNFEITLRLDKSEAGQFLLKGMLTAKEQYQKSYSGMGFDFTLAEGVSPSVQRPNNITPNERLLNDKVYKEKFSIRPEPSCTLTQSDLPVFLMVSPGRKVTTADVMQAIHKATGRDIVADYFTQVYDADQLTMKDISLFEALMRLSETMRFRWTEEENFLNFRSARFFYDRQKEIPDRLLERWADSRRKNKRLTVNDFVEIARLSDAQLDSNVIAAGVMANFKLQEWEVARSTNLRPHWRFLGQLAPVSRQAAVEGNGLNFEQLPLGQRLLFAALAFDTPHSKKEPNMDELAGATLRVAFDLVDKPVEKDESAAMDKFMLNGRGGNIARFIYTAKNKDQWHCIYGPFNAILRLP